MADLDTLRPEVLEAMRCVTAPFDPFTADSPLSSPGSELHNARIVAADLLRLAGIESEFAAIKARIAEAPLEVVESLPGAVGPPWPMDHWIEVRMADPCACVGQGLIGKRVRLVVEE